MRTSSSALLLAFACLTASTAASALDLKQLTSTGLKAGQALTLSDQDVAKAADEACVYMDQQNKVAPANSPYAQRLARIDPRAGQHPLRCHLHPGLP